MIRGKSLNIDNLSNRAVRMSTDSDISQTRPDTKEFLKNTFKNFEMSEIGSNEKTPYKMDNQNDSGDTPKSLGRSNTKTNDTMQEETVDLNDSPILETRRARRALIRSLVTEKSEVRKRKAEESKGELLFSPCESKKSRLVPINFILLHISPLVVIFLKSRCFIMTGIFSYR